MASCARFAAWALLAATAGAAAAQQKKDSEPATPPAEKTSPEPSDERVQSAWSLLSAAEKREAIEWLKLELKVQSTFQLQCLRFVVASADRDAGFWPDEEPVPFFDPAKHAPAQPIPRTRLDPKDERARELAQAIASTRPPRALESAWSYDWAGGELRRRKGEDDPDRLFRNALRGYPPDADLAEALVLRALDTGEQRAAQAAFAHAYTDRAGNVFPCTLYEAWAAGVEIEMPDVDVLGIVHDVQGEWNKWRAPVPTAKQQGLYKSIGELFAGVRRYRGLREALAAAYLNAEPVLHDGYGESLTRFHALWNKHAARPASLAPELPKESDEWTEFLAKWAETVQRDPELYQAGVTRANTLAADSARVRATLVWVLEQLGAFERKPSDAPAEAPNEKEPKAKEKGPPPKPPEQKPPERPGGGD